MRIFGLVLLLGVLLIGCTNGLSEADIDSLVQQGISEFEESQREQILGAFEAQLDERILLLRNELTGSDGEESLTVETLSADEVIASSLLIQNENQEKVMELGSSDLGSTMRFFSPNGESSGIITNLEGKVRIQLGSLYISDGHIQISGPNGSINLFPENLSLSLGEELLNMSASSLMMTSATDRYIVAIGSNSTGGASLSILSNDGFVVLP